jgi:hypothetical protein
MRPRKDCARSSLILAAAICAATSDTAFAQTGGERPVRRIEVSAGGGFLGGGDLGEQPAALRANSTGAPAPFNLFTTSSRFDGARFVEARLGYALTRRFAAEASFVFGQPELRTSIRDDIENAPALSVAERVDQYFVDATVIVMLDALRIGSRTVPFASAGAGYLRQLHEGQTLIETGQVYHVGGGLKHWLAIRDRGFVRGIGMRADARAYVLVKGIDFKDRPRPHGAISGALFVTF